MALMSRNQPSDQARTGQSVLRALVADYRGTMILLALMSFVGALLEAFFLVIVTGVAIGSGNIAVGVRGSVFSLGLILLLEWGGVGAPRTSTMRVKIKTSSGDLGRISNQVAALSTKAMKR